MARPDPSDRACDTGNEVLDDAEDELVVLFDESNYEEWRNRRQRWTYDGVEQGGFLLPDGEFIDLSDINGIDAIENATACDFEIDMGALDDADLDLPDGTIFIHSHPWSHGDDQEPACGTAPHGGSRTYQSGPGDRDGDALDALQDFFGIEMEGVVLDGDGIHFFDEDGETVDTADRCY